MKYPTEWLCVEKHGNRRDVSNGPGYPHHCHFVRGPEHLPGCGFKALVPVPEGERMVVVVTENGEWPAGVLRRTKQTLIDQADLHGVDPVRFEETGLPFEWAVDMLDDLARGDA